MGRHYSVRPQSAGLRDGIIQGVDTIRHLDNLGGSRAARAFLKLKRKALVTSCRFLFNPHRMRIRFPLGLVFALVLPTAQALSQATPAPSLTPSSSPTPAGSRSTPAASLPTPPPMTAIPSASPAATAPAALPIPVPPSPQRELLPLVVPPAVGFRFSPPSAAEIDRVIPQVEVWRPSSNIPQSPKGRLHKARRLLQACVSGNEPVTVRLRFHPLSNGKTVLVKAARGIALVPADEVLRVPADGQIILSIALDSRLNESHVSFSCEGLTTTLVLARTGSSIVAAREIADAATP